MKGGGFEGVTIPRLAILSAASFLSATPALAATLPVHTLLTATALPIHTLLTSTAFFTLTATELRATPALAPTALVTLPPKILPPVLPSILPTLFLLAKTFLTLIAALLAITLKLVTPVLPALFLLAKTFLALIAALLTVFLKFITPFLLALLHFFAPLLHFFLSLLIFLPSLFSPLLKRVLAVLQLFIGRLAPSVDGIQCQDQEKPQPRNHRLRNFHKFPRFFEECGKKKDRAFGAVS